MEDIRVRIIFPAASEIAYNWRDFATVFGELEQIAYRVDRDIVFQFCRLSDVPDLHRDAALERLRQYRNRRVLISDIRRGSWVFDVAFSATAGVVLWKTLGEPLVDAYKETRFRQELKDFAKTGGDWLLLSVTNKLRSSKEFLRARIERQEREVIVRLPGPSDDKSRTPSWRSFRESLEDIDQDRDDGP